MMSWSPLFNILRPVPLIRHTRVGLDFLSDLHTDAANHAIFGPSAFHRAAMASQAAYRSVQTAQTTHGSRRQTCMPLPYNPHAIYSKLSCERPPAALARRCKKVDAPLPQHALCRCPHPQHARQRRAGDVYGLGRLRGACRSWVRGGTGFGVWTILSYQ